MTRMAVVTDSGATLPEKISKRFGILVAPFTILLNGQSFLDGVDIGPRDFFARLRESEAVPKTSMVQPQQWLDIFSQAAERAREILCITVSETLSGTHQAAKAAAETFMEQNEARVRVVDSLTAGGAQGLLVERAAEWGQTLSLDDVAARLKRHLPRANLFFMVNTLKYAAQGGRVSHLVSWVSDRLSLKPIMSIRLGEVGPVDRPRTRRLGLERLVETLHSHLEGGVLRVAVNHGDAPEDAHAVLGRIQELMNPVSAWISDLTPVLGTHSGPDTIAVSSVEFEE